MKLRATIVVDFDAVDYVDAAKHQGFLEQFLQQIIEKYPEAKLAMRERRERNAESLDVALSGAK